MEGFLVLLIYLLRYWCSWKDRVTEAWSSSAANSALCDPGCQVCDPRLGKPSTHSFGSGAEWDSWPEGLPAHP